MGIQEHDKRFAVYSLYHKTTGDLVVRLLERDAFEGDYREVVDRPEVGYTILNIKPFLTDRKKAVKYLNKLEKQFEEKKQKHEEEIRKIRMGI